MNPAIAIRVLHRCRVAPPPGSAPPTSLPLTFFDIPCFLFPPYELLFFFQLPIPTSHFTAVTLPKLKHSLSLTLLEYFPFSGRLIQSPESETPEIVYSEGDSVAVTVAEADGDFDHFCGHHSKDAGAFHELVPRLSDSDEVPMMAVQITVFSNAGISIGLAVDHAVADGRTFANFIKTWSSIFRDGENSLPKPFNDRSVIKEVEGLKELFLQQWRKHKKCVNKNKTSREDDSVQLVRATFVTSPREMEKIKQWIMNKCERKSKPPPPYLTPWVLTCAFVWVFLCEARAGRVTKASPPPDTCFFGYNGGAITRLDYAVPAAYLGNCLAFGRAEVARKELMGEEGIVAAAEAFGRKMKEVDGEVLGGAERWISEWEVLMGSDVDVVAMWSAKLDLYGVDFGWGRPRKIEEVSIDAMKLGICVIESRDINGGLEVGLVLPKNEMDVFSSLFHEGLKVLA